jgi:hypothetical protein
MHTPTDLLSNVAANQKCIIHTTNHDKESLVSLNNAANQKHIVHAPKHDLQALSSLNVAAKTYNEQLCDTH